MQNGAYNELPTENGSDFNRRKNDSGIYFLRQLVISNSVWMGYFLYGLSVGAPTVFIPQINKEIAHNNKNNSISDDMASWITSAYSFSGFVFVIVMIILAKYFGRKLSFTFGILGNFIAFVVLYFSSNTTHILISEVIMGISSASHLVVSITILPEYTSPKNRGLFLTLKSATFYWGIWASNAIGTFFHWKLIAIVGMALAILILMTLIVWPESPYWLASKGKFEKSATSHQWLKGIDEDSHKELHELITTQKAYQAGIGTEKQSFLIHLKDFFSTVRHKKFYKPFFLCMLTGYLSLMSGKLAYALYCLDIVTKITNSESMAYKTMIILDGITVLSMYGGCVLSKYFRRRPLLLQTSCLAVVFMLVLSLYSYLISLNFILENNFVTLVLLSLYSIAVSSGPLLFSLSIFCEIVPVRSRNLFLCVSALMGKLSTAAIIKLSPYLFKHFGFHGAFLSFGIASSIIIALLFKYLPETKDKTLQEIINSF